MPALLTHDYFGDDVWSRVGGRIFDCLSDEAPASAPEAASSSASASSSAPTSPSASASASESRRAFLLGNQGPDPFFYTLLSPRLVEGKRFGSLMHHEKVAESIEAFRRLVDCPEPAGGLILAYLLGFVCHFTLDSIMHPFVYAQQNAICDAGIKGLDRRDGSTVHGQIEATLDMMMLCRRRGVGISEYNYTRDVLKGSDGTLALLDTAYRALAHEVYAVDLPANAFSRGVKDMRLTIRLLYSPRGVKRRLIGGAERLFARHSFAQAMSPPADVGAVCDFDNRARDAWADPFTGKISHADFDELYAKAQATALDNIFSLLEGKPVTAITRGLDFEGKPIATRVHW
jgi:hypothetical protein